MAAVDVVRGRFDRQVRQPRLLVDRHLRPHAGVAGVVGGIIQPRVGADLTLLRNRVEDPETLARSHVVSADVALVGFLIARRHPFAERRADEDGVLRDDRRGLNADFTLHEIDGLIVFRLQIDRTVLAEARDRHAGLRVQRDQAIAHRRIENPLFASVGPIRHATARPLARRPYGALAFVLAVRPELLARRGVDGHDRATAAGGCIEDAFHHQRRRFETTFRSRPEVIGPERPGRFERAEICGGDLIERTVLRVREISAVTRPLSGVPGRGSSCLLSCQTWSGPHKGRDRGDGDCKLKQSFHACLKRRTYRLHARRALRRVSPEPLA